MQTDDNTRKPLKAVVFDLDGLMFNTEGLYHDVDSEVLARRGRDFPDELCHQMMGRKSDVALQMMIDWHQLDDTVEQLAAEIAKLFDDLLPRKLAPMPGLMSLLEALESADLPKAIATSSGRQFARTALGLFELEPRFEFVLTSNDITHGKPAPDVYLLAAERLGVAPEQMMVLEDSQTGCQAAVASGAFTVAVPDGLSTKHRFPGARLIADTLADRRIRDALDL